MNRLANIKSHLQAPLNKNTHPVPLEKVGNLKNKTMIISGASRGIGLAIALRAAKDGANVAILAKTAEKHPKLEGTIYTAAKEIETAGGKALPIKCDMRFEDQVQAAIDQTVEKFGGIDIVVNNASAISLTNTPATQMKRYDLMHSVNTRGTFLLSKLCIPHLMKSSNPHILNLSPPLNMSTKWFENHVAYTMAKYGMSMCVLGMSGEFKGQIGVNALWPRTSIATAAVQYELGGDYMIQRSRKVEIMSDAAYEILTSNSKTVTGNFFVDDDLIGGDLKKYNVNPEIPEEDLMPDFFLE